MATFQERSAIDGYFYNAVVSNYPTYSIQQGNTANRQLSHLTFTCSNSAIETLEKGVEFVQS